MDGHGRSGIDIVAEHERLGRRERRTVAGRSPPAETRRTLPLARDVPAAVHGA